MLEPHYTTGDMVEYDFFVPGFEPKIGVIVEGPYREGIWWEYKMDDGALVRDGEIIGILTP